jgi:hypothetical protein
MIPTYKKMAALAVAIGQPHLSQRYLSNAEELMSKQKQSLGNAVLSDEDKRREAEERSAFVHQQYIAATSAGDYENALKYTTEQEQLLIQLNNGVDNSKVCSNMFLKS